jgi:hypothetical protein
MQYKLDDGRDIRGLRRGLRAGLVYQVGYDLIVNNIYSPSRCYTVLQLI